MASGRAKPRDDPGWNMSQRSLDQVIWSILWWMCLLVAPAVLVGIELYHPAGFTNNPGMYEYVSQPQPYDPAFKALAYPGPWWWFTMHMVQTPMVVLVGIGLLMILAPVSSGDGTPAAALAWLGRLAILVFLIYYTALDSIGGFGLARSIEITEQMAASGRLSAEQVDGVRQVLNATWTDGWVGGVGSFVSKTGSWAVFIGVTLGAAALWLARKAPWPALILLLAFGWELQLSHTAFHGPIAFALLIAAALWVRWRSKHPALPDPLQSADSESPS